jgi:hypothetical protein
MRSSARPTANAGFKRIDCAINRASVGNLLAALCVKENR